MPNINKYTHQDVVAFIRDGVVPEGLSCSIGYHLMRRPVYMHEDASRRPYEASAARRTLELKAEDPYTRNDVALDSALVPADDVQQNLRTFRAMVLGYTKAATYVQALDKPWPGAEPCALKPPASGAVPPREQVIALQTARNAALKLAAQLPPMQPSCSRQVYADARDAFWRSHDGLPAAKHASTSAEAEAKILESIVWFATQGLSCSFKNLNDLGVDTPSFEKTFGHAIVAYANAAIAAPSPANLQAFAQAASEHHVSFGAMLLYANGQILEHMIYQRAWAALAAAAPSLTTMSSKLWSIRRYVNPDKVYLGQRDKGGKPHGQGIMATSCGTYEAGSWHHGKLHGSGMQVDGDESRAGHWDRGQFLEGRYCVGDVTQIGAFDGNSLRGHGISQDALGVSGGHWADGKMIRGIWKGQSGDVLAYGPSDRPDEDAIGVALGPKWDFERYCGVLTDGQRHGLGGVQIAGTQEYHFGLWQHGRLSGPGARVTETMTEYGVWANHERRLSVTAREYNDTESESESESDDDLLSDAFSTSQSDSDSDSY